jgi:hypothetical protein
MVCNAQVVTLKSDIYSFGMVLWEVRRFLPQTYDHQLPCRIHPSSKLQPGILCACRL